MSDDFEKAVLFSFDQTGRVDGGIKAQAQSYLQAARASPDCWQLCLQRFESSQYLEVRFWCAQTLTQLARHSYRQLPEAARMQLKRALIRHGTQQAAAELPGFLKNKVAQAIVAIAGHEYPDAWPSFFQDLLGTLGQGPAAVDLFCRRVGAAVTKCNAAAFCSQQGIARMLLQPFSCRCRLHNTSPNQLLTAPARPHAPSLPAFLPSITAAAAAAPAVASVVQDPGGC